MIKIRFIISILSILISLNIFSQRRTAKIVITDSLIILKEGIYLNIDEFLNNEPSISCEFEVTNNSQNYIFHPEENNFFYVSYYDNLGSKTKLLIKHIWGYYNGNGVFVSFENRPYELLYLGAISVLRYDRYYTKNAVSQAVSLNVFGATTTSIHKVKDAYLDLGNDTIVPRKRKQFERLISKDIDFYNNYKKDRKTHKQIKPMIYLQKYNRKYPVSITQKGKELSQN